MPQCRENQGQGDLGEFKVKAGLVYIESSRPDKHA